MCNNTFAVNISQVIACKLILHVSGVDSMWQNKLLVNKTTNIMTLNMCVLEEDTKYRCDDSPGKSSQSNNKTVGMQ